MFMISMDLRFEFIYSTVKEKCGIRERENYNKSKNNDLKQSSCPIEREETIKDAFKYFKMI